MTEFKNNETQDVNNDGFKWPENSATNTAVKRNYYLLLVTLILLLAITLLAFYIYYGMNHTPYDVSLNEAANQPTEVVTETTHPAERTPEEKMQILLSLESHNTPAVVSERLDTLNKFAEAANAPLE